MANGAKCVAAHIASFACFCEFLATDRRAGASIAELNRLRNISAYLSLALDNSFTKV